MRESRPTPVPPPAHSFTQTLPESQHRDHKDTQDPALRETLHCSAARASSTPRPRGPMHHGDKWGISSSMTRGVERHRRDTSGRTGRLWEATALLLAGRILMGKWGISRQRDQGEPHWEKV